MLASWATEIVLITLRDLQISPPGITWKSQGNRIGPLPAPGDYLATFVIWAPLSFLADTKAAPVAEAIGWAYVLATLLNLFNPSNPLSTGTSTPTQPAAGHTGINTSQGG
jgi:hypothetical protein